MKKLNIIILFLILTGFLNAQYITHPQEYKLSKTPFKEYGINQIDKKLTSIIANPNKSKYPISNFIVRIFSVGDTVWFATGSGLMRTTDHFNTFDNYYEVAPFGTDDLSGFTVYKNLVVVATATSEEISGENIPVGTGIKVSTDYGLSWNSFPQPMDGLNDTSITYGNNHLHALAVVVPQQNLSYDIEITRNKNDSNNYTIWLASWAGSIRKSTDYGNTWQRVVLPPDELDSIIVSQTGYTFSVDVRTNYNHRAFSVKALNDSTLFVGTANGINKSTDWGLSWRKYNHNTGGQVSGNFVVNLYIQRYSGKEIIWGATRFAEDENEKYAISYTTNYGINWANTLVDVPPRNISSKDSIVFAESDNGLWRSYFGKFDWSKPGLIYDEVTKDQLKTSNFYSGTYINDTLYFGSGDGLCRTLENGQPWTAKWKIFRAMKVIDLNSDIKTYAAPNPFAPKNEVVRIFYKSGKATSKITIKIFDFGMNPVRTVIQNAIRNSPEELFTIWDGKNNDGYQVANGVYFYRIEIDSDTPVWGKILVIQ
ncbi:MAG: hypothetical protein WC358_02230 [Ignavibacteria bacterium]